MKHNLELTLRDKQPDVLFQWWEDWHEPEIAALESRGYYPLRTGAPIQDTAGLMWLRESAHLPLRWPVE